MPRPTRRQGISRRVNSLELRRRAYDNNEGKNPKFAQSFKRPGSQKK